jgi:hypothetical protein
VKKKGERKKEGTRDMEQEGKTEKSNRQQTTSRHIAKKKT